MNNQDYVLSEFRRLASASDPAPYTVCWNEGVRNACVWMSVAGDVDWYDVRLDGERIVSAKRASIWFGPDASKYIGSKQAAKIVGVVKRFWADNGALVEQMVEPSVRRWNDMLAAMPEDVRRQALNPCFCGSESDGRTAQNIVTSQAVDILRNLA